MEPKTKNEIIADFFKSEEYTKYDYGQFQRKGFTEAMVAFKKLEKDLADKYGGPIQYKEGRDLKFEADDRSTFGGFTLSGGRGLITNANEVKSYLDAIGKNRIEEHYYEDSLKKKHFHTKAELEKLGKKTGGLGIKGEVSIEDMIDYTKNEAKGQFEAMQKTGGKRKHRAE